MPSQGPAPTCAAGPLLIDTRTREVTVYGRPVTLTAKEYDLLLCLAEDPGRVYSRQQILERAWDAHFYGPTKALDVHVASLRRKLAVPGLIETVYGVGFRLAALRPAGCSRRMTRRILAALVGLTAVLLAAVVVPLGAVAAHHDAQVFVERTEAAALALASQAEERLADERRSRAERARSPCAIRTIGSACCDLHGQPLPAISNAVSITRSRPQRSAARPAQRALDRRPEPLRRRASR